MTKTVRVPSPAAGTGYRVIRGTDGRMTTVPLLAADVALYRPLLAMDAAIGGPKGSPDYASYNATDDDPEDHPAASDLEDKIRQLLEGKLDDADIDMLIQLIQPDDNGTTMPAQDRGRRRQAADRMPSKATVDRLLAEGAARRADRVLKQHADLMKRFPALRGSRVVG